MNKQAIICSIIGVAIGLIGLWGGSYILHALKGSWAEFPAFATMSLVITTGIFLTAAGIVGMVDP